MTHPQNDAPQGGMMIAFNRVAGKALSLAAVAALTLPLVFVGQGAGLLPGAEYDNGYLNVGQAITEMVQEQQAPAASNDLITLKPVSSFQEHYSPSIWQKPENVLLDTQISGMEALGAMGAGALAGLGGIAAAAFNRRLSGQYTAPAQTVTFDTPPMAPVNTGLMGLFAVGALSSHASGDGRPNAAAGAAAGMGLAAAVAVASVPYAITAKAVYDNFIRPESSRPATRINNARALMTASR